MPQAVTHIVFAILIGEFIREVIVRDRKKFPVHYIFICGLAGILPDFDIAAFWILHWFGFALNQVHRTFTHTLFIPVIALLISIVTLGWKNKQFGKHHLKLSIIFLMIAIGTFSHLILDTFISGKVTPFYPIWNIAVGFNMVGFLPKQLQQIAMASLDAGIFILWLIWLEYRHKISSFM